MNTTYKYCIVPTCENTSDSTPDKIFINVPTNRDTRNKWLTLARIDPSTLPKKSYFCEDHFDIQNDMENYMEIRLMGQVSRIRLRRGCLPTRLACQSERANTSGEIKEQNTAVILPQSAESIIDVPNTSSEIVLKFDEDIQIKEETFDDMRYQYYDHKAVNVTKMDSEESSGDIKFETGIKLEENQIKAEPLDETRFEFHDTSSGNIIKVDSEKFSGEINFKNDVDFDQDIQVKAEPHDNTRDKFPDTKMEIFAQRLESEPLLIKCEHEDTSNNQMVYNEAAVSAEIFETRSNSAGDDQILVRENSVSLFRCGECNHQSKRKHDLKQHMLLHKDPSQVQMFRCQECHYQSKRKRNLREHVMLVHESASTGDFFICNECNYRCNTKGRLKQHVLVHKTQVEIFKCEECSFGSKHKRSLKQHMWLHKDPAQVQVFKCQECDYQSRRKHNLKEHVISVHEGPLTVEMFKCKDCNYQGKTKNRLRQHLSVHDMRMRIFKCVECSYQCKRNLDLKRHILVHRDPSQIEMFKCSDCDYQCKIKYRIKQHMLVHQDRSQVRMYKCEECGFETKFRGCLKRHLLVHKKRDRVECGAVVQFQPVTFVYPSQATQMVSCNL